MLVDKEDMDDLLGQIAGLVDYIHEATDKDDADDLRDHFRDLVSTVDDIAWMLSKAHLLDAECELALRMLGKYGES